MFGSCFEEMQQNWRCHFLLTALFNFQFRFLQGYFLYLLHWNNENAHWATKQLTTRCGACTSQNSCHDSWKHSRRVVAVTEGSHSEIWVVYLVLYDHNTLWPRRKAAKKVWNYVILQPLHEVFFIIKYYIKK